MEYFIFNAHGKRTCEIFSFIVMKFSHFIDKSVNINDLN